MPAVSYRFARAAAAAALVLVMAPIAPAWACDVPSATGITCPGANSSSTSPLKPASPFHPKPPPAPPVAAYGDAARSAPADGSGGLLGVAPPAPASIVTPGDGYEPQDTRILRHRHLRRRPRQAD